MSTEVVSIREGLNPTLVCKHCKSPITKGQEFFDTKDNIFCCSGCRSVFSVLSHCNLDGFYAIRDSTGSKLQAVQEISGPIAYLENPDLIRKYETAPGQMRFFIEGLQCAACVWVLEKMPDLVPGIHSVRVDALRKTMELQKNDDGSYVKAVEFARNLGYSLTPILPGDDLSEARRDLRLLELKRLAVAAVAAGNIMLFSFADYFGAEGGFLELFRWMGFALSIPVYFFSAITLFKGAWATLKTRVPSLDLPLAVALLAGWILSVHSLLRGNGENIYFDSLTFLIFLILASRYFVSRIQDQFTEFSKGSIFILPRFARKQWSQKEELVDPKDLRVGDIVRVLEGETIPCDGVVESGNVSVDESLLSGESVPRMMPKSSVIYLGTKAVGGEAIVRVSVTHERSRVASLLRASLESATLKGDTARSLERWSQTFTWIVLSLSLMVLAWFHADPEIGFQRAFSLLVVACPCALAFGFPLLSSLSLSKALENGIVFRSSDVLMRLLRVKRIWFDKTGTLTDGELQLSRVEGKFDQRTKADLVAIESLSRHPVAKSIVKEWSRVAFQVRKVESFYFHPAKGVEARVEGQDYKLISLPADEGLNIRIKVLRNDETLGILEFEDHIREESHSVVQELSRQNFDLGVLSGDQNQAVAVLAKNLGVSSFIGRASPEKKMECIDEQTDMMVGDGVNDVGAMSKALVGITVSGTMEKALAASDVLVLGSGVKWIPRLFTLAQRTQRGIRSMQIFSISYNLLTATLAMLGVITPFMAALLMPFASISVLVLSVRAFRGLRWT